MTTTFLDFFHVISWEIVCCVCRRVEESRSEHGEEEADDWKFQEEKVCEFKGHANRENLNIYTSDSHK